MIIYLIIRLYNITILITNLNKKYILYILLITLNLNTDISYCENILELKNENNAEEEVGDNHQTNNIKKIIIITIIFGLLFILISYLIKNNENNYLVNLDALTQLNLPSVIIDFNKKLILYENTTYADIINLDPSTVVGIIDVEKLNTNLYEIITIEELHNLIINCDLKNGGYFLRS